MRTNKVSEMRTERCRALALAIRMWTLEQSFASRVGHIGSVLSVADVVAALWAGVMRNPGSDDPLRDRFIFSKGHAVMALYCSLRWGGILSQEAFETYCSDGSNVAGHPLHTLPGVELSTGSLGQGLSVACGLAYGLRLRNLPARVFALCSDGECNEGQVWEAVMFAAHHKLTNLVLLIDQNGSQCMGRTNDIIRIPSLASTLRSFGWAATEVDGHDIGGMLQALDSISSDEPSALVARTTLGKGVSFMEGNFEWHYRNIDASQLAAASAELKM